MLWHATVIARLHTCRAIYALGKAVMNCCHAHLYSGCFKRNLLQKIVNKVFDEMYRIVY